MNLREYVQMSAHMCTNQARQMRMADVCVVGGGGSGNMHDGKMLNRHGSTVTAL